MLPESALTYNSIIFWICVASGSVWLDNLLDLCGSLDTYSWPGWQVQHHPSNTAERSTVSSVGGVPGQSADGSGVEGTRQQAAATNLPPAAAAQPSCPSRLTAGEPPPPGIAVRRNGRRRRRRRHRRRRRPCILLRDERRGRPANLSRRRRRHHPGH